jgi:hypothetical protein
VRSIATEDGVLRPEQFWDHVKNQGYAQRIRHTFAGELV